MSTGAIFGTDQKTIEACERDSELFVAAFHKAIADAGVMWSPQYFKIYLDFDNTSFPKMFINAELFGCERKETK